MNQFQRFADKINADRNPWTADDVERAVEECQSQESVRSEALDAKRYRYLRQHHVRTEYADGWINFRWYDAPMHGGGNLVATLELHRASCDAAIDRVLSGETVHSTELRK